MKRSAAIAAVMLVLTGLSLSAQSVDLLEGSDLKNRDVEVVNLSETGKDKLKLGVSLGYPEFGLVGGWQMAKSMELDVFLGSLNYDSFCLGGGVMFSVVDVEIGGEIFPVTVGPFVNAGIGPNDMVLSFGGKARMEYTFDFRLNLYLESGLAINIGDSVDPWNIPFSLGIRYSF